jgi:hypothetical protein
VNDGFTVLVGVTVGDRVGEVVRVGVGVGWSVFVGRASMVACAITSAVPAWRLTDLAVPVAWKEGSEDAQRKRINTDIQQHTEIPDSDPITILATLRPFFGSAIAIALCTPASTPVSFAA